MDLGVLKHFRGVLVGNPITDLLVFLKAEKHGFRRTKTL